MKKLAVLLVVAVASFCLAGSAFAGSLAPGQMTKCNNAKSITLENTGGGGATDRGEGNASIWKSSNFTTVPISLSPQANHGFPGNGGGAAGNAKVKMGNKHSMGRKAKLFCLDKITLAVVIRLETSVVKLESPILVLLTLAVNCG